MTVPEALCLCQLPYFSWGTPPVVKLSLFEGGVDIPLKEGDRVPPHSCRADIICLYIAFVDEVSLKLHASHCKQSQNTLQL
ncbi:MAG: hypothetical protein FWC40_07720 [Proteobacteria bacterium]|nr:hypothetical protein [Pseudomonadota bacterium]